MKDLLIQTAKRTDLVNAEQLAKFLEENSSGQRLDEVLLACPYFTEDMVLKLFAEALGCEFLSEIRPRAVPVEFVEAVPAAYAQHHFLIGIKTEDGETVESADTEPSDHQTELTVVLSKPLDTNALDNVSKMTGLPVRPAISTRATITSVIDVAYEQRTTVIEEVAEELDSQNLDQLVDEVAASDDLLDVVNRPPVIRLVNDILFRALQLRASDIHVHPYESKIQIRYRIDGILYDTLSLNRNVLPLVISRIKVMAGMDIAERRLPQDGRCSVRLGQREVDLRISTVPTSYGERSVLRLLDKSTALFGLNELGLCQDDLNKFDSLLTRSHGVIFVTGPTGSGKSTTRVSARRDKPDAGCFEKGCDICKRSAACPSSGPGCYHDRGSSRHRNRTYGNTVFSDRSFGFQHTSHKRLGRSFDPAFGFRPRAVSGKFVPDCCNSTTIGTKGLPGVPGGCRTHTSRIERTWHRFVRLA
jgi:general secretion pathway protein E